MIHGYCRKTKEGRIILGFIDNAPIFKQLAEEAPTQKLSEAVGWQPIIGYSVVRRGEAHGFLWYSHEHSSAKVSAQKFTDLHNTPYDCVPLTITP
jgi:hypothetical protein